MMLEVSQAARLFPELEKTLLTVLNLVPELALWFETPLASDLEIAVELVTGPVAFGRFASDVGPELAALEDSSLPHPVCKSVKERERDKTPRVFNIRTAPF